MHRKLEESPVALPCTHTRRAQPLDSHAVASKLWIDPSPDTLTFVLVLGVSDELCPSPPLCFFHLLLSFCLSALVSFSCCPVIWQNADNIYETIKNIVDGAKSVGIDDLFSVL